MAICTKRRRKLQFEKQTFFWHIQEQDDGPSRYLTVVSENKHFLAQYDLSQSEKRIAIVISKSSLETNFGKIGRFRCPPWEIEGVITPRSVRNLLSWCYDRDRQRIPVDYWGQEV